MYEYNNNQEEILRAQAMPNPPKKQKKQMGFWGKIGTGVCVGIAFGVVAGVSFAGVNKAMDHFFPDNKTAVIADKNDDTDDRQIAKDSKPADTDDSDKSILNKKTDNDKVIEGLATGMDVSGIVESTMPSVVSITNKSVQEVMSMWGTGVQQYESTSAGSGIIVGENDDELLIATNNHVIADSDDLSVGFIDEAIYTAYVKGYDEDLDLAVVAVKKSDLSDETKNAIKVATINDSDDLKVGEQVVAIGNALGYGQSVTTGIVSALDRDVTDDNVDNPLIQTDAAINPGNSGGALLNMKGELVGINSAKIASTSIEGVGYAIPMTEAVPVIESLMNRQTREEVDAAEAGYIGISGVSVDSQTSEMYDIPVGVYIQTVEDNSPAEAAGLVKGDVIRKFDGITVSSINDIRNNLNYYKAGETVDLDVYRSIDGEYTEKTISITLGDREGTALDESNQDNSNGSDDKATNGDDGKDKSDSIGGQNQQQGNNSSQSELPDDLGEIFNIFGY